MPVVQKLQKGYTTVKRYLLSLCVVLLIGLTACADEGNPAEAVQNYLEAKVAGDADQLAGLLCAEMESQLDIEAASFASVEATIEGMRCERGETTGDYTLVTCEGTIVATYGTEDRDFPLETYRTVQEDGEWKWCGEG